MQTGLRCFGALLLLVPMLVCAQSSQSPDAERALQQGLNALERRHFAKAYCLWEPLASRGHPEAQYHLGWLYANGHGMNVDVDQAIGWWEKAAEQGHAEAQFALGLAYTTGESVKRDMEQAVRWYVKAARNGHEDARDIVRKMVGVDNPAVQAYLPELSGAPWLISTRWVAVPRANVRSGPGTDHKVLDTLTEGTPVDVLRKEGEWTQILLDGEGRTAWIFAELLK